MALHATPTPLLAVWCWAHRQQERPVSTGERSATTRVARLPNGIPWQRNNTDDNSRFVDFVTHRLNWYNLESDELRTGGMWHPIGQYSLDINWGCSGLGKGLFKKNGSGLLYRGDHISTDVTLQSFIKPVICSVLLEGGGCWSFKQPQRLPLRILCKHATISLLLSIS